MEVSPLASDDSTKLPPKIPSENVHILAVAPPSIPPPSTVDPYPFPSPINEDKGVRHHLFIVN